MTEKSEQNNIKISILYFLLSTIITAWFIEVSPIYNTLTQKILSFLIAGSKWSIQIVAAYFLLQNNKSIFLRNIGYTSLLGSIILVPYSVCSMLGILSSSSYFLGSLIISVATMIVSYWKSVRSAGVEKHWWAGWMVCLAIAIAAQLKVVFNITLW